MTRHVEIDAGPRRARLKAIDVQPSPESGVSRKLLVGSQTLVRGIEVLAIIANGRRNLPDLAEAVGLSISTTHRLAVTLVEHRLLNFEPRVGYTLGPRVMELGFLASRQMSLPRIAHDFLVELARVTGDTVHLGMRDGTRVLYLDKIVGSKRLQVSSRIGERQPLRSTGLGKALLLDEDGRSLVKIYESEAAETSTYAVPLEEWLFRMKHYAAHGYSLDLSETEDNVRCVASPVRDASGRIIGAISVTSASQYMDDDRINTLIGQVKTAADGISAEFGWRDYGARVAGKKGY